MTKIHVVCGGTSNEREVSLRSGSAVTAALRAMDYDVVQLDPTDASPDMIAECDVVFPVLHGAGGEDGSLQAELESRGIAFVGSGSAASALCFDKSRHRDFMMSKVQMAHGTLVTVGNYDDHVLSQGPFVLKPITGGSSIDTHIVRDTNSIAHDAIRDTFSQYPTMLLEELIDGIELTVGILGDTPLPVIEIIPPAGEEFDYENKYNGDTQELCPAQHVNADTQQAAQELALKAHRLTGCRDFSRTDMICDTNGTLYLLETNTIPGMTDQSLFPKMAATAGMSMPELCRTLIDMALNR